ncbi:MAG: cellulose biosynthesis cyclic di-GMP-binding regulatory protein BcsB, partial [Sulfuricella sp.]
MSKVVKMVVVSLTGCLIALNGQAATQAAQAQDPVTSTHSAAMPMAATKSGREYTLAYHLSLPTSYQNHEATKSEREYTLAYLLGTDAVVTLRGIDPSLRVSLPLPALALAQQATLHLVGTASAALNDDSWLLATINGHTVAQFPLHGTSGGEFAQNVSLPAAFLHSGFNELRIQAIQHYTKVCEYPLAPQLWTQIDPTQSTLNVMLTPRAINPDLAHLDVLFDKTTAAARPVVPVFYGALTNTDSQLALALTAQGVGLRYVYVPVSVVAKPLPWGGGGDH